MNRRQKTGFALAGLLLCLAAAGIFIASENRNYREKMEILFQILAAAGEKEERLAAAAGLLKGKEVPDWREAEETLNAYGYAEPYQNRYRREMLQRQAAAGGVMAVSWGLWLLLIFGMDTAQKRSRRRENEKIRNAVWEIRKGKSAGRRQMLSGTCESSEDGFSDIFQELDDLAFYTEELLESAAEEKKETKALVTEISHQLKTPVAALLTSFEILEDKVLSREEYAEFYGRCKRQIERLQELTGALVNISRMEKGMIEIHKEKSRIFDTVVLAVNRVFQMSQERQIEIEVDADEEVLEQELWHDSKWLSEALINLLENALKYSPPQTTVTIRMIPMNLFFRIEIEDEGVGVPSEERNLIFKRFYRGNSEAVQKSPGNGVGLFLARKILECHQGMLTVTAPVGKKYGSAFILQIPYERS